MLHFVCFKTFTYLFNDVYHLERRTSLLQNLEVKRLGKTQQTIYLFLLQKYRIDVRHTYVKN